MEKNIVFLIVLFLIIFGIGCGCGVGISHYRERFTCGAPTSDKSTTFSLDYDLDENKLFVQNLIKVNPCTSDKTKNSIILTKVELDTGSSDLIINQDEPDDGSIYCAHIDSKKGCLLENAYAYNCNNSSYSRYPQNCSTHSPSSSVSLHPYINEIEYSNTPVIYKTYLCNVSMNGVGIDMGVGFATKQDPKDYSILGLIYSTDFKTSRKNFMYEFFKSSPSLPKSFTFSMNSLTSKPAGSFSIGTKPASDLTYLDIYPSEQNKYFVKIKKLLIDSDEITALKGYHISIDTGARGLSYPHICSSISPSPLSLTPSSSVSITPSTNRLVELTLEDKGGKTMKISNTTDVYEYCDQNPTQIDGKDTQFYCLMGIELLQNYKITFDHDNNRVGFKKN